MPQDSQVVFGLWDILVFLAALIAAMTVGFLAGRKEETSEDYFLAGKSIPWWGVAGSIFGSNVSANHMVGMMGVGMAIGFAQSHFEIGAIAGLTLLCYGFLPVYRKLNVYTLSEYLEHRYDHRSRLSYAVIMVIIMVMIQLAPGLYIGSRSMCILAGRYAMEAPPAAAREVDPAAANAASEGQTVGSVVIDPAVPRTHIKQSWYVAFVLALAAIAASYTILGGLKAVIWTDFIQSILLLAAGIAVALLIFYQVGGWNRMMELDREAGEARQAAEISAAAAGEAINPAEFPGRKMGLYRPMSHPKLPWTGVLTGLMIMHCFYWGTNQFIVQRALGARSDRQARLGIIAAGFLKLTIPFFAIAGGVAAFYMFRDANRNVAQDAAFTEAMLMVIPANCGLIGLISAGLIGAILSSIDSMMNSAATIVTIDIYRRYFRPQASDREMINVGRMSILFFVSLAALLALLLDPNTKSNFFLLIADWQNYFTPGLLVAFGLGMLWKRGTPTAGFAAIVLGVVLSFAAEKSYNEFLGMPPTTWQILQGEKQIADFPAKELPPQLQGSAAEQEAFLQDQREALSAPLPLVGSRQILLEQYLGPQLNFFHRMVVSILLCTVVYVGVSYATPFNPEKGRMIWTDLGGHQPYVLKAIFAVLAITLAVFVALGMAMTSDLISPFVAGGLGGLWTLAMFASSVVWSRRHPDDGNPVTSKTDDAKPDGGKTNAIEATDVPSSFLTDDRILAGILCGAAVFMLYYFR
ncbi:SLC5 family protein [Lignipirellula cremea]|uniref:Sodium/glucose cotransporter n=1 Tax=Lignipirellula cremea TaxID=2528010 RepID=A0A518DSX0_9BACT|nr:sodium/solute symporter [Lignipirellula cremea]QDU94941.1 Sodium/glucose cotransporter [Lignipirellula cremea]